MLRKTVAGIELKKTIGRHGHHRWIARIAGRSVMFTPTVGRYNNRINGWDWYFLYRRHQVDGHCYGGGTLTVAVINAHHAAVEELKHERRNDEPTER